MTWSLGVMRAVRGGAAMIGAFEAWAKVEGCEHCIRVLRVVTAVVADFVICASVIIAVKLSAGLIEGLVPHQHEAAILQAVDFYGKLGVLCLLGMLLIRDVWVQVWRDTSPPCP